MNIYLSLVIPAFNEEKRIESSIHKALDYFAKVNYDYEIIIVDDGSNDNTTQVIQKYINSVSLITLPNNAGKGAAVREGMKHASGKFKIFSDADFATPITEIEKLLIHLEAGADLCIGSRAIDRSFVKVHQPFYREFMGKIFNFFVQNIVFSGIKDTQCGFKGFSNSAAEFIFNNAVINGFSFDVELLFIARKAEFKIVQVPVEWFDDKRSTVNPIFDSINMLFELIKIRAIHNKISY